MSHYLLVYLAILVLTFLHSGIETVDDRQQIWLARIKIAYLRQSQMLISGKEKVGNSA
jgi:hypothetical protein